MENQNQINMTDNFAGAEYSNAVNIGHNKEEFHLIFANILPPAGRVVAKLITTPAHFKRMIAGMNDNLAKYEQHYGKIEEVEIKDNKEIGFKE